MSCSSFFILDVSEITEGRIDHRETQYTPHAPIRINSNADFDAAHGVVNWATGNGTEINPWVIEGWDINGTGYGYCIYVGNTTEHFVVKDCNLYDSTGVSSPVEYFGNAGLNLCNVANGKVQDNIMLNNANFGAYVSSSNNVTITNCNASGSIQGVIFQSTMYSTIANCTMYDNGGKGINLYFSTWNSVTNNTASSNNDEGIYLRNSDSSTLINNTATNNDYGIYIQQSYNVTLTNNTASYNNFGIYLYSFADGNTLKNNTASSNNQDGIVLRSADSNTLTNNTISSNGDDGIYIQQSYFNTLKKNTALNNMCGFRLSNSDRNTFTGNTATNNFAGIYFENSDRNTFANNSVSSNDYIGIYIGFSDSNTFMNNTASSNDYGFSIRFSEGNTLKGNVMADDGIFIDGFSMSNWNTHTIDTSNTVNGKPVQYWKNQTGGTVPPGAGEVILANCTGVTVENQNVSGGSVGIELGYSDNNTLNNITSSSNNEDGIQLWSSSSNTLTNNTASSNNDNGIYLGWSSSDNTLSRNTVSGNFCGINISSSGLTVSNNTISYNNFGIYAGFSIDSLIYHNKFINNTIQAFDNMTNLWNLSYPAGGNYWSDYVGVDLFSGPNQDVPGCDGIGDTNYTNILGGNVDEYPLMSLSEFTEYEIQLQEGWNLVSLPLEKPSESIIDVLQSIDGKWDCIRAYDAINELWLSNVTSRPDSLNDLHSLNHKMGFWINITEPGGVNLTVRGYIPISTVIPLYAGWNLVGYPSLTNETVANALWGTGADNVLVCDISEPYLLKEVGPEYVMQPGEGYWVHVPADTVWVVDW
jgi:parallel beta-helix repeat protein